MREAFNRIREAASTTRPTSAAPATGISSGAMMRLRSALLASGSAVARSAQATIIHSTSVAAQIARPVTKIAGWITRPNMAAAAPNAPTTGQMLWLAGASGATSSIPRYSDCASASPSRK